MRLLRKLAWLGGDQSGQVLPLLVIMMPALLAVIGLSIDSGVLFNYRRALQNVADSAARAGAMQVDVDAYRASSGASVVLDTNAARDTAMNYLASQPPGLTADVSVDPQRVVVHVSREVPTEFMRVAGIKTVHMEAVAPATVRYGIQQANGQ